MLDVVTEIIVLESFQAKYKGWQTCSYLFYFRQILRINNVKLHAGRVLCIFVHFVKVSSSIHCPDGNADSNVAIDFL